MEVIALNKNELRQHGTYIAEDPAINVSNKYSFISTYKVIESLGKLGWQPHIYKQQKTKVDPSHTKHMVRLIHEDNINNRAAKKDIPEIVVLNSHNCKSSFKAMMGVYRFVCTNGLIIADSELFSFNQKHINVEEKDVINIVKTATIKSAEAEEEIENFKNTILTESQSKEAAELVQENLFPGNYDPSLLLQIKRDEDNRRDLYTVINRIQEWIIKGGIVVNSKTSVGNRRQLKKPINNIKREIEINNKLWAMMTYFYNTRGW